MVYQVASGPTYGGDEKILVAARRIVEHIAGLRAGERVVLATDPLQPTEVTHAVGQAIIEAAAHLTYLVLDEQELAGAPLRSTVATTLIECDVLFSNAGRLLTHTDSVREMLRRGGRYCNLRDLRADTLLHGAGAVDYAHLAQLTAPIAAALSGRSKIRVCDRRGTDLSIQLDGGTALALDGQARQPGRIGGVPAGEAAITPSTKGTVGKIVRPYLIEGIEGVELDLEIEIVDGIIVALRGAHVTEQIHRLLNRQDLVSRTLSEFAVGTNPRSRLMPGREAKKSWGSIHLGFGDNATLGGDLGSESHFDVVVGGATVFVDGVALVADGAISDRALRDLTGEAQQP